MSVSPDVFTCMVDVVVAIENIFTVSCRKSPAVQAGASRVIGAQQLSGLLLVIILKG